MNRRYTRPVLLAVGDEDDHDAALRFAAGLAVHEGRPLELAHVVHPPIGLSPDAGGSAWPVAANGPATALLESRVSRAERVTRGRVPVRGRLAHGQIVPTLADLADRSHCLVLQHRCRPAGPASSPGLRVHTDEVAAGVAAATATPVVSVPELWDPPGPTHRVLVGLDDATGNESLLEQAFREAFVRSAALTVLHSWFVPPTFDDRVAGPSTVHAWRAAASRQVEAQVGRFREAYPTVTVHVEVPHMRPADALVEESGHHDLVLVGCHPRADGTGHVGAVARAVARETRCPVLLVSTAALVPTSTQEETR